MEVFFISVLCMLQLFVPISTSHLPENVEPDSPVI